MRKPLGFLGSFGLFFACFAAGSFLFYLLALLVEIVAWDIMRNLVNCFLAAGFDVSKESIALTALSKAQGVCLGLAAGFGAFAGLFLALDRKSNAGN